MDKMNKTDLMNELQATRKELQRYKGMDKHLMYYEIPGLEPFLYTEDDKGCRVVIVGTGREIPVKPLRREAFVTWCHCWKVDNAGGRQ